MRAVRNEKTGAVHLLSGDGQATPCGMELRLSGDRFENLTYGGSHLVAVEDPPLISCPDCSGKR